MSADLLTFGRNHLLTWWWQIYVKLYKEFIHLAGIIIEKLFGKIPPLSHWDININEKGNKYKSSLLSSCTNKALKKYFLKWKISH